MTLQTRAPAEEDDAVVIERSRSEPEVFEIVFRRYADQIQRYVSRRIGADAADDVVAETFLLAFRQRDRYDATRATARPWLYGIATNLIARHRRAEVRHYRALARVGVDEVAESFTDRVDAAVSASAVNRSLATALADLPAGHRDALLLIAWGDLSHEEAAAALGIQSGTVRSRIHRARTQLRRSLGDTDPSALHEENQP
ncbi:MAG: RNA polymerase sigma factor [Streptosporangiaceae bacterium]|jgi:RNA polymerase sigma factor (sigma-70 family)